MKRSILVCVTAVALAGSAWAQDKEQQPAGQAPAMDMSKMGPEARKPTNEAKTKKEVQDFFKKMEDMHKTATVEDMAAAVDFPVYMATDDLKGVPEAREFSREEYVAMMKPAFEHMPKDMKMTHKPTITVLSDSLVSVTDEVTTTMGKQKMTSRNGGLLVKRDGQWKWKAMVEAGWGGMQPPGANSGSQMPSEPKK
ncbi:hypothetical protein [Archangium sp.]|uniref:hypothetical protein n=1 Tax=Archangium sp. TaxID=1872627 RepID=UPI00389AF39F